MTKGKLDCDPIVKGRKTIWNIGDLLGHVLVSPCSVIKTNRKQKDSYWPRSFRRKA